MSKQKEEHHHKLKRIKYTNGEQVYYCINGACKYEVNVKKSLGKPNICHRCNKVFNLNEASIRLAKPHCINCTKGKEGKEDKYEPILPTSLPLVTDLRSRLNRIVQPSNDVDETKDDLL